MKRQKFDELNAVTSDTMHCLNRHRFKQLKGSMKELNMFHNYETENITRKASDVAENLQLYRVVRFFIPEIIMNDDAFNVIL